MSLVSRLSAWMLILGLPLFASLAQSEVNEPACETSLSTLNSFTKTIRLLWWPDSAYRPVTHMAIEVNGNVWEALMHVSDEGPAEHHFTAARRRRGIVSVSINVTELELSNLDAYFKGRHHKLSIGSCSGSLYKILTKFGIMKGSSIPATAPTPLMATLMFRKLLGDRRIGKVEWIGRKGKTKIFPYPKIVLLGPIFEGVGAWGFVSSFSDVSPDIAHTLIARGQDLYSLLMPLMH